MKNIKYESEFIRTITAKDGVTEEKVFLNIYHKGKMIKKIDLGKANSEKEAEEKVDRYLKRMFEKEDD